ncbi:MAG: SIMPL domain-containing protein [Candidatus Saccharibacteria bacterium]
METNNNFMPKWLTIVLGISVVVLILLFIADKGFTLSHSIIKTKPDNTISMSAEGKVNAVPDLATVNLGVLAEGKNAALAEQEATKKVNQITEFVKQQGVDKKDITTSNFSINPRYNYHDGKSDIVGYDVSESVMVKVRGVDQSTEMLGKILQGAVDNGSNVINGVSLTFDDPDNLKQEARKLAINKAKEKAQDLAKEAGIKLGKVISISEAGSAYPTPVYSEMGYGGAARDQVAKSVAPNIEAGSQDVVANITVTFEVK